MAMNSLYECAVSHCRLKPKKHAFDYNVFMFSVDLDQIPKIGFLGHNRFNLFSIFDKDHIDLGEAGGIRPNLSKWLLAQGIDCPSDAKIRLITFPRVLGYGFNPVSFYYIESAIGEPIVAVAEVVNTFHEMKLFVLPERNAEGVWNLRITKNFYVSPFSDPALQFDFRLGTPDQAWEVHIDDYDGKECMLVSSIHGQRKPLTASRLLWYAFKYPAMSLKIIGMIHWHAFLLWLKKVPFLRKAERIEVQLDVLRPHPSLKKNRP